VTLALWGTEANRTQMRNLYTSNTFVRLSFVFFFIAGILMQANAQCPVGSIVNGSGNVTNGKVLCISATVSNSVSLKNGGTMVVVSGGKYTGSLDANSGSTITVNTGGELSPSTANSFSAALTNNGVANLTNINLQGGSVTNNGTLTWGSMNLNSSLTLDNSACGTMIFSNSYNFSQNGAAIANNGKLIFNSDLTTSSGTTINNRGSLYVKGNFSSSGLLYNQYKMVVLGSNVAINNADSVINLFQMIFKSGFIGEGKIRNEGLFWVGGSFEMRNSGRMKMNNTNAQLRVNGSFTNNVPMTSSGSIFVAGAIANNQPMQGISSSLPISLNRTISNGTSNVAINTSMMAYDTTNYTSIYANPAVCNSTLPVELSPLQTTVKNNAVQLNWFTTYESNTQAFFIEYSVNGVDFATVGTVKAAGNSNSKINYSYTHTPGATGSVYYRLRSVDTDGQFKYSNVAIAKTTGTEVTTTVFPNPFTEKVSFTMSLETPAPVSVALYDASGRLIQKVARQGQSGTNQVTLAGLNGLVPGIYMAHIVAGERITVQKLIK